MIYIHTNFKKIIVIESIDQIFLYQIPGGQYSDKGVQEQWVERRSLPKEPADEDLLEPVECGWLGNEGRAGEDGLVEGALHSLLP